MKSLSLTALLLLLAAVPSLSKAEEVVNHLQNVSVTIVAGERGGQGSGVLVTRDVPVRAGSEKTVPVSFVWTAAHVVDSLRTTRTVTSNGKPVTIVEFEDAFVVQELVEDGRMVGEVKMAATVIRYSDADEGHDLALLMVRKRGFAPEGAKFYLEGDMIVPIGTPLYHVGSLLGQVGANSMTTGIMSKVGRVLDVGQGAGTVFDQTSATAFPGSSGGGIFMGAGCKKANQEGLYVGMLVRGAGEQFNFIVPVRRMKAWAEEVDAVWALDEKALVPSLKELDEQPVEDDDYKTRATLNTNDFYLYDMNYIVALYKNNWYSAAIRFNL
jgi:hypothetical protein